MSNHKLNIVFYVNGMPFNHNTLNDKSLGGSETMGLLMSQEMAKRGHDVIMFCNTDKINIHDNLRYMPIQDFNKYMAYSGSDVCVVQRIPDIFGLPMKSKLNILWQHDLSLKRNRQNFRGVLWNIDEIWGLSDFHINQMSNTMQVPKELFWKTRNGINPVKNFGALRQNKRLIYTSRPERGMDILINNIMPLVWERDKDIELYLAGYDNVVPQMKSFYDLLHNKINEYKKQGRKVEWLGYLTKKELYKEYQKATMYVYPSNFEEISCITVMECMANGLSVICSEKGALPETLSKETSVFVKGNANDNDYQNQFVNEIFNLLNNSDKQESLRDAGYKRINDFKLDTLAEEWENRFYGHFENKTNNKDTLAKHFYRNEDIMALKELNIPEWNEKINKEYPFISDDNEYKNQYQEQGKRFYQDYKEGKINLNIQSYARIKFAMELMRPNKPKHILDYGCGIGNEAVQFVNEFDCNVTAVNISPDEMEIGKELAKKYCKNPDKINWIIANKPEDVTGEFDIVFAGEILEHMAEPQKFIDNLEKKCVKGGLMIYTVPTGAWGDTDFKLDMRGHLWNFEKSDLKNLFDKKNKLNIAAISGNINLKNKEMLGWYVIKYEKDNEVIATGHVDLHRKISLQSPRQTLSACMIVGGQQEGLLHRCLKSIDNISDEIIISDTGMTDICREIIKHYPKVRIINNAPNPLEYGFAEARNFSIKEAKGDWILWIDSDEELLLSENIYKYLRNNHYNGYSIRQHHFSAQPPNVFKPDLPVRLFRNGKGIKFFGYVHEHPEIELNKSVGFSTIMSDVDIAHDGYLTEEGRRKRFNRNYKLLLIDRERNPDRELGKFLIMRDYIHMVRYIMEQTKGQLTQEIIDYCNKTIEMYRNEFLGKNEMMAIDGLMFYSEALTVLNKGLEYDFSIDIKPMGALAKDNFKTRFENKKDFIKFIEALSEIQIEHFSGDYV